MIEPVSENKGEIGFFKDWPKNHAKINEKTSRSARFAVLVMNPEDKYKVKKSFETPLVFSIQEGHEYDNIILVNFISDNSREFRETNDLS